MKGELSLRADSSTDGSDLEVDHADAKVRHAVYNLDTRIGSNFRLVNDVKGGVVQVQRC